MERYYIFYDNNSEKIGGFLERGREKERETDRSEKGGDASRKSRYYLPTKSL